jgi:hypothetical protein
MIRALGLLAWAWLVAAGTAAGAAELEGRLFFRMDERALLDDARRRPERLPPPPPEPGLAPVAPAPAPPPPPVTLNGIVRRSDGTSTVWLNGRPASGRQTSNGLEVLPPGPPNPTGRVTVRVPESGRRVDLGVGQQIDVTSGEVSERFRMRQPAAEEPAQDVAKPAPVRRPGRDRELLRDLLRELDPSPAARTPDTPAAATAESARPD